MTYVRALRSLVSKLLFLRRSRVDFHLSLVYKLCLFQSEEFICYIFYYLIQTIFFVVFEFFS